jgi:hypothetical protein
VAADVLCGTGVLGELAKDTWFAGAAGTGLHYGLALAGFSRFGDSLKSAACAATPDSTNMAQTRFQCLPLEADYSAAKAVAQLKS